MTLFDWKSHSHRVIKFRAVRSSLPGIIFFIAIAFSSQAQNPANQQANADQARQTINNVPPQLQQQPLQLGVNVGQAVPTPGDLDLGIQMILKKREAEQPFRLFADVAEFYTNNVALTRSGKQGDNYFFADVGCTYTRKLTEDLTFETTLLQGFFRYSKFASTYDFEDFNVGGGLTYDWKKLWNLSFFGRYNFERFTQGNINSDFYSGHSFTFGAQKTFTFNGGNYIYVGYSTDLGLAFPTSTQRDENGFYGGVHYNFTSKFSGDLSYRITVFNYTEGRTDLNQTTVATLAYTFNDHCKLTGSLSYASDISSQSAYNYDLVNTGGGLALQIKF